MLNSPPFYLSLTNSPNLSGCEVKALWQSTLQELSHVMPKASFASSLMGTQAISLSGDTVTVAVASAHIADWLNHRMRATVSRVLSNCAGTQLQVEFVLDNTFRLYRSVGTLSQLRGDSACGLEQDTSWSKNASDEQRNDDRYFSKHWRPLLGPLLSELVRELRDLAHEQGNTHAEHALVQVQHEGLAHALGVSRSTVARAMCRLSDGTFQSAYLNYFLSDVTVQQARDTRGQLRGEGLSLVVRLTNPPVPVR